MEVLPAIDIRGGRCVRLMQGDFARESDYGDPVEQAGRLVSLGATRLHVVDLDGARTGDSLNRAVVLEIARRSDVPIEVGGGLRDLDSVMTLLSNGVERVVLGTAAIENETFAREVAERHPGRVVLGLDHRRVENEPGTERVVAVRGWESASALSLEEAIVRYRDVPFAALAITDISVDGTLKGPDLAAYSIALSSTATPIIASGGIGSLEDLAALIMLEHQDRRLAGVIIGRALYSGAMTVKEAMDACAA